MESGERGCAVGLGEAVTWERCKVVRGVGLGVSFISSRPVMTRLAAEAAAVGYVEEAVAATSIFGDDGTDAAKGDITGELDGIGEVLVELLADVAESTLDWLSRLRKESVLPLSAGSSPVEALALLLLMLSDAPRPSAPLGGSGRAIALTGWSHSALALGNASGILASAAKPSLRTLSCS